MTLPKPNPRKEQRAKEYALQLMSELKWSPGRALARAREAYNLTPSHPVRDSEDYEEAPAECAKGFREGLVEGFTLQSLDLSGSPKGSQVQYSKLPDLKDRGPDGRGRSTPGRAPAKVNRSFVGAFPGMGLSRKKPRDVYSEVVEGFKELAQNRKEPK
jgi:hypothetical protein